MTSLSILLWCLNMACEQLMRKRKEDISKPCVSIYPLSLYKKLSSADWNYDIQNHNLSVYCYNIGQIMIVIRSVDMLLCL